MLTYNRNFSDKMTNSIFCSIGSLCTACRYEPAKAGIDSDHIQVWADFEKTALFGQPLKPEKVSIDRHNLDNPRIVCQYNCKFFQKITEKGWDKKLKDLDKIPRRRFSVKNIKEFDQAVCEITKI